MSNYGCKHFSAKNGDSSEERLSKFEVGKVKRRSLIPLPKSNVKSQGSPLSPPQATTGKYMCSFKRNFKSVHSSTIPPKNDPIEKNIEDVSTSNHSEGSLIATSKNSSDKLSQILLEWKNDTVSFQIEGCDEETKSLFENVFNQSKSSTTVVSRPQHPMVRLAKHTSKIAERTRGYFFCPICSEAFCKPAIISCGHLHCMQCICNWFDDQDSCPVCRYRIIHKNVGNTLTAKQFFESGFLLASVFNAGNLCSSFENNGEKSDLEYPTVSPDQRSDPMTNFISSAFRKIYTQENFLIGYDDPNKSNNSTSKVIEGYCFMAAIWFLRQGIQVTKIDNFQTVLKWESQHGSESSREDFLKHVMNMKIIAKVDTDQSENESRTIPPLSLQNYSQKGLVNGQRYPRLRPRLPSMQGLGKILMTCFLFAVIALAVYLFDDSHYTDEDPKRKVNFYKMDLLVYSVTLFSMAAYTETERITHWRRRRRGNNTGNQNQRDNRHRLRRFRIRYR